MQNNLMRAMILGFGATILFAAEANAHGAFAIGGSPSEAATKGLLVGASYDFGTDDGADARAIKECEARRESSTAGLAPCQIVTHYSQQWLAVAMDRGTSTPGFGWSIDADQAIAENNAMNQCKICSPDSRKQFCEISILDHDSRP